MNHTTGTWSYDVIEEDGEIHIVSDVNPSESIATIYSEPLENINYNDAEMICKAVNLFPGLIGALQECKDYFDYMKGENHVASRPAREKVLAALDLCKNVL